MRKLVNMALIICITFSACNYFKSDHPQATSDDSGTLTNKEDILTYADSLAASLKQFNRDQSLVYTSKDYSFFVSRYSYNNQRLVYVEKGDSAETDSVERKYYLKNNQPVLVTEMRKTVIGEIPYSLQRDFLRNGIIFYSEMKHAANPDELKKTPFYSVPPDNEDVASSIDKFNQAIAGTGKFDLNFEGITEYPKAQYLILSKDEVDAWRAPVLIEDEDDFVKMLMADPNKFKGRKLDLAWKISPDGEAVYVSGKFHSN